MWSSVLWIVGKSRRVFFLSHSRSARHLSRSRSATRARQRQNSSRRARSATSTTALPRCRGTCSSPGSRRCCGGTLPQGAGTTCWTDLAAPHQKRPLHWRTTPPEGQLVQHRETWHAPEGDGEVELGQVQHQLDRNITWLCCQIGKLGRKEMGPWCDMDQSRHAKLPGEHNQDAPCVWRQETQNHVAQSQQSPRSRCARAVAEQRLSHHTTTVRTTHGAEH